MESRILIFTQQSDAASAVSKIGATMGLNSSTFVYAIPAGLEDGRWFIPYPGDAAWLSGVAGYTVANGTGLVAVGEAAASVKFVPPSVTNFQARAVLLQMPSPSGTPGRTLFEDVDAALHAAGGVGLQAWEYANDVTRSGPLVASLGSQLGLTPAQLDQLFIAANGISA